MSTALLATIWVAFFQECQQLLASGLHSSKSASNDCANRPAAPSSQQVHLFTASARTPGSLRAYVRKMIAYLEGDDVPPLADICYSSTLRTAFGCRLALAADSLPSLRQQLQAVRDSKDGTADPGAEGAVLGFSFPDGTPHQESLPPSGLHSSISTI